MEAVIPSMRDTPHDSSHIISSLPPQRQAATQAFSPRRVLVLSDLSPAATNAAWRGALVARDHGAWVRLLHVRPNQSGLAQTRSTLEEVARDIQRTLKVAVMATAVLGDIQTEVARASDAADLLVIRARSASPLRDWLRGLHPDSLIRWGGIPTLLVQRPATGRYRRVLVSVDIDEQASGIIAAATVLSRGPHIEVLHALGTLEEETMRIAQVPEGIVRSHRRQVAQRAQAILEKLIDEAATRQPSPLPAVLFGHTPSMVLAKERSMRAELVTIGRRAHGRLAGLLVPSVSRRVIAGTQADVLVLPVRGLKP